MPLPRPLHLGLTGNIASGKSTVARQLAALGATVIDADCLAREAVAAGTAEFQTIVQRFGPDVLSARGDLDRAALRRVVFHDAQARAALNAIVHPAVQRLRDVQLAAATTRGDLVVVSDIPLLFEVGLESTLDGVILVDAPVDIRKQRLVRDRGLAPDEANAMIAAQWPSEGKRAVATWVIDNDGSAAQLQARVAALWRTLLDMASRHRNTTPVS